MAVLVKPPRPPLTDPAQALHREADLCVKLQRAFAREHLYCRELEQLANAARFAAFRIEDSARHA